MSRSSTTVLTLVLTLGLGSLVAGAPQTPSVPMPAHDFNFGAYNQYAPAGAPPMPEWQTNGLAPDTLTFLPDPTGWVDKEATAYWPAYPPPPPVGYRKVYPIFDALAAPTFPWDHYASDFQLNVMFTGQDAPFVNPGGVSMDVSLVGTGANPGADLVIMGTIPAWPNLLTDPPLGYGPLWEIDLKSVSLYGYSPGNPTRPPGSDAYVLEGTGKIVGGLIAQWFQLVGGPAVVRGHLDFPERPGGWIPSLYDPVADPLTAQFRAAYSGETLGIPEPTTFGLVIAGLALVLRRRR